MAEPHPLVAQLRARREENGLSRRRVAALVGFSVSTLEQWEWGQRTPTLAAITRYANAVGLDLALTVKETPTDE